jgi:hypothetical protein
MRLLRLSVLVVPFVIACQDAPTATVDPADLQLLVVSGDGQEARPFEELPEPLVVKVVNATGKAGVPNQIVNFKVVEGGGSVYAGVASTDQFGIATEYWTLGDLGPQQLEARAVGPEGEKLVFGTFTATARIPEPELFFDEAAFLAATGAQVTVTFPNERAITNEPYVENGVTFTCRNSISDYTPVLPNLEFAISGVENCDLDFAMPITAFGMWMQDGFLIGDINAPGRDSQFTFTFYAGAFAVATFEVDPPIDVAFFVGAALDQPVDKLEIREVVPDHENDFFGVIYTK